MKKSFTLIELIISIMILSILFLAMSNVLVGIKKSKNVLNSLYKEDKNKNYLIKVLYYDILNAKKIKVIHTSYPRYDRLLLQTKNSLYNLDTPYVAWFISKKDNALIRLESISEINFSKNLNSAFVDLFRKDIKIFKIYRKNGKDFIYIKSNSPIYFEMVDKEVNTPPKSKIIGGASRFIGR